MRSISEVKIHPSAKTYRGYEQRVNPLADDFYKDHDILPDRSRCSFSTPEGKRNQLKDIDLFVEYCNKKYSVSEKYRRTHWEDYWIEVLDEHHSDRSGWGLYSKADLLFYLSPSKLDVLYESKLKPWVLSACKTYKKEIYEYWKDKSVSYKKLKDGIGLRGVYDEDDNGRRKYSVGLIIDRELVKDSLFLSLPVQSDPLITALTS